MQMAGTEAGLVARSIRCSGRFGERRDFIHLLKGRERGRWTERSPARALPDLPYRDLLAEPG